MLSGLCTDGFKFRACCRPLSVDKGRLTDEKKRSSPDDSGLFQGFAEIKQFLIVELAFSDAPAYSGGFAKDLPNIFDNEFIANYYNNKFIAKMQSCPNIYHSKTSLIVLLKPC